VCHSLFERVVALRLCRQQGGIEEHIFILSIDVVMGLEVVVDEIAVVIIRSESVHVVVKGGGE